VEPADVAVLMGSARDWKHVEAGVEVLRELGISHRVHVTSAHRTPVRTRRLVEELEASGCRVFICAAGMAAHLAGVVASWTVRPVLGVPLPGGVLDGVDALLSTVQMPAGVPVATLAVGAAGARNAAFLSAQILAVEDSQLASRLRGLRARSEERVIADEDELRRGPEGEG